MSTGRAIRSSKQRPATRIRSTAAPTYGRALLRRALVDGPEPLLRYRVVPPAHRPPQLVPDPIVDGPSQVGLQRAVVVRLEPLQPGERAVQAVLHEITGVEGRAFRRQAASRPGPQPRPVPCEQRVERRWTPFAVPARPSAAPRWRRERARRHPTARAGIASPRWKPARARRPRRRDGGQATWPDDGASRGDHGCSLASALGRWRRAVVLTLTVDAAPSQPTCRPLRLPVDGGTP